MEMDSFCYPGTMLKVSQRLTHYVGLLPLTNEVAGYHWKGTWRLTGSGACLRSQSGTQMADIRAHSPHPAIQDALTSTSFQPWV